MRKSDRRLWNPFVVLGYQNRFQSDFSYVFRDPDARMVFLSIRATLQGRLARAGQSTPAPQALSAAVPK